MKKKGIFIKKKEKKENTIHDFDFFTKILWKHVEIIFIIQVGGEKKKKKKGENIHPKENTIHSFFFSPQKSFENMFKIIFTIQVEKKGNIHF